MADASSLITALEHEYDLDEGFLGLLRAGHFDSRARDRFINLLATIDLGDENTVDRRLVALLWYIPMFLQWQMQRLDDDEGELRSVMDQATTQLERILGVP